MASPAQQAAEELKQLAARIQPLFTVAAALEEIGSLDQAAHEAKNRKELAYKQADEAASVMEEKTNALKALEAKVVEATEQAAGIVPQARKDASKIVAESQAQAAQIVADAQVKKDAILKDVKSAENQLKSVQNQVAATGQELAELQKNLKDTKAKLASFLK